MELRRKGGTAGPAVGEDASGRVGVAPARARQRPQRGCRAKPKRADIHAEACAVAEAQVAADAQAGANGDAGGQASTRSRRTRGTLPVQAPNVGEGRRASSRAASAPEGQPLESEPAAKRAKQRVAEPAVNDTHGRGSGERRSVRAGGGNNRRLGVARRPAPPVKQRPTADAAAEVYDARARPAEQDGAGADGGNDEGQRRTSGRERRKPVRLSSSVAYGRGADELTMIPPANYASQIVDGADLGRRRSGGATTAGPQPFKLNVLPAAELIMDVHSHLFVDEVIGFLGGQWDEETRTITVERAFPARALSQSGRKGRVSVEMDPESEVALREQIRNAGMRVVGWYHSHPLFVTLPSIKDCINQSLYQMMFSTDRASTPFVGAIVGPYDPLLPLEVSDLRWFHVSAEHSSHQPFPQPWHLRPETMSESALPPVMLEEVISAVRLLGNATYDDGRANLNDAWRVGFSRLDKLRSSVLARVPAGPPEAVREAYARNLAQFVRNEWSPVADEPADEEGETLQGAQAKAC